MRNYESIIPVLLSNEIVKNIDYNDIIIMKEWQCWKWRIRVKYSGDIIQHYYCGNEGYCYDIIIMVIW